MLKHKNPPHPHVSVVIPAFNEAKNIHQTLESILNQTYQDFELIVVDNNSTDNTAEIAGRYGAKVIYEPKKGVTHARQAGFLAAKGEIIVSTDADAIHPPDWIERIVKILDSDRSLVAVGGIAYLHSGPLSARLVARYLFYPFLVIDKLLSGGWNLSGFSMAVRKDAFLRTGGFDPNLQIGEDIDLSKKLRKLGKVILRRDIVSTVSGRRYKRGLLKGILDYLPSTVMRIFFRRVAFNTFKDVREE
ncbi:MAG: glycosyl transferase [Patescibacteria group bacterium]|nr:MAG: glycosyl transferase [Patescibacteria group bacterium]